MLGRALVVLFLFVSGCTSVVNSTRVGLSFSAREFNNIASLYLERPTFAVVESMSDGHEVLRLKVDGYSEESQVVFRLSDVDGYLAKIDKFFDWEKTATTRGDSISRDIGLVPTWGGAGDGEILFRFHSGNSSQHFLALSYCSFGTCLNELAIFLDAEAVVSFRRLLGDFKARKLIHVKEDSIYR